MEFSHQNHAQRRLSTDISEIRRLFCEGEWWTLRPLSIKPLRILCYKIWRFQFGGSWVNWNLSFWLKIFQGIQVFTSMYSRDCTCSWCTLILRIWIFHITGASLKATIIFFLKLRLRSLNPLLKSSLLPQPHWYDGGGERVWDNFQVLRFPSSLH